MKILHSQSQLKRMLVLGIAFTAIGAIAIFISATAYLAGLGGIGLMYIVAYIFYKNRPYVTLTEKTIIVHGFIKRKIEVETIESVTYFAGDYKIKSSSGMIVVDTNLVDKESVSQLKTYFDNLQISKPKLI